MKVVVETKEVPNEGLESLLGENVEIWCGVYIYAGKLIGVNEICIKLENPHIVYETGGLKEPKYKDAQPMTQKHHYVMIHGIESFGATTKL